MARSPACLFLGLVGHQHEGLFCRPGDGPCSSCRYKRSGSPGPRKCGKTHGNWETKKDHPLELGKQKTVFLLCRKKGGWIGLCCCSINQEVDKGHLRLQMPIVWLRLQLRMFHALPLPDDIICMYIYI
jgi:hypothetical protein